MSHNPFKVSPVGNSLSEALTSDQKKIEVHVLPTPSSEVQIVLTEAKALFLARCLIDAVSYSKSHPYSSSFMLDMNRRGDRYNDHALLRVIVNPS